MPVPVLAYVLLGVPLWMMVVIAVVFILVGFISQAQKNAEARAKVKSDANAFATALSLGRRYINDASIVIISGGDDRRSQVLAVRYNSVVRYFKTRRIAVRQTDLGWRITAVTEGIDVDGDTLDDSIRTLIPTSEIFWFLPEPVRRRIGQLPGFRTGERLIEDARARMDAYRAGETYVLSDARPEDWIDHELDENFFVEPGRQGAVVTMGRGSYVALSTDDPAEIAAARTGYDQMVRELEACAHNAVVLLGYRNDASFDPAAHSVIHQGITFRLDPDVGIVAQKAFDRPDGPMVWTLPLVDMPGVVGRHRVVQHLINDINRAIASSPVPRDIAVANAAIRETHDRAAAGGGHEIIRSRSF